MITLAHGSGKRSAPINHFLDAVADVPGGTNTGKIKSLLLLFFRKEDLIPTAL
jgi:hypothetical protein